MREMILGTRRFRRARLRGQPQRGALRQRALGCRTNEGRDAAAEGRRSGGAGPLTREEQRGVCAGVGEAGLTLMSVQGKGAEARVPDDQRS